MSKNKKYSIENLEWQQFEVLAYKCLCLDVSPALNFIEGGNDKGRDFVFKGKSEFLGFGEADYNYIFQAKHKSNLASFKDLKQDLNKELYKVFVENSLDYDIYCLVTNLTITGSQYDALNQTFNAFIEENQITRKIRFGLYPYRNLEACIDRNDFLKWVFPSIVRNTDFKVLIEDIIEKNQRNISSGWLAVFNRNKDNFVYTNIFEKAFNKLNDNNILLFSGPSKSGKTFNAEMLLFKSFCSDSFIPYKIDRIDEFDRFFNAEEKQIFLFDDAFGRYNLEPYRADSFDRKLEYIFELTDENHKCVFTSREYIYKAFLGYADKDVNKFISKINVDVSDLLDGEKESILLRYHRVFFNEDLILDEDDLRKLVDHEYYSPESIRAYFNSNKIFSLYGLLHHLDSPDEYLEKDFKNLSEEKQMVLISTLTSLSGMIDSIAYNYDNISEDLGKRYLMSINDILNQLDGSILNSIDEEYTFYHPSMFDFFVGFISKDNSVYRRLLLKNFNLRLLSLFQFKSGKGNFVNFPSRLQGSKTYDFSINQNDLESITEGFHRILRNPETSLIEYNSIFKWIDNPDLQINLKLKFNDKYLAFKTRILSLIKLNVSEQLFFGNKIGHVATFFENIYRNECQLELEVDFYSKLMDSYKSDSDYWLLVFRVAPFLNQDLIFDVIPRKWFAIFFKEIRDEINSLGFELYGTEFPNFEEVEKFRKKYEQLFGQKKFKEARELENRKITDYKKKTSKYWYPRYLKCKERMHVLKTSHNYGRKIYEELTGDFYYLQLLEQNQFNRFIFLKQKKWW